MIEQRVICPLPKASSSATLLNQIERDHPADGAQADIHRAGPVDAETGWIGFDEVVEFARDFDRVALVSRETKRLTEDDPVLAPAKLPWILDVGIAGSHLQEIPLLVGNSRRESQPPDRIPIPVDRRVTIAIGTFRITRDGRTAAEQVELVPQNPLSGGNHRLTARCVAIAKRRKVARGYFHVGCGPFATAALPFG